MKRKGITLFRGTSSVSDGNTNGYPTTGNRAGTRKSSVLTLNKKRGIEIPLAFLHFAAL
jgi:hypothetical protein